MAVLSREQIDAFWRDGYLMVDDAVTPEQLAALKAEIADWVEESRAHAAPFGPPTIDGRPRFDMGAEHSADKPALRRINNPSDISDAYREVMLDARTVDMVADLIGPDVKFHHCKINLKLSGAKTEVSYHQDFAYTPHTNSDIVTALLFLDDIDESNGCLTVVPGSHKGPMLSLFDGERFTGGVAADEEKQALAKSVPCLGKAGSVCLMHTKLLHGSAANGADKSRGLYICVYTAADAVPIARNPDAEPERGPHRARQGSPLRAPDGRPGRTAQAAQDGVVLHRAGPGVQAGRGVMPWAALHPRRLQQSGALCHSHQRLAATAILPMYRRRYPGMARALRPCSAAVALADYLAALRKVLEDLDEPARSSSAARHGWRWAQQLAASAPWGAWCWWRRRRPGC